MKTFRRLLLAMSMLASLPSLALAQTNNELNPDPQDGASITSDNDGTAGEQFTVTDNNDEVIRGDGNSQTTVSNQANAVINYDSDDSGSGTFAIRSGGADVISANNAGNVSVSNTLSVDSNGATGGGTRFNLTSTEATTTSTDGNTTSTVSNSAFTVQRVDGSATNSISVGNTQTTAIGANSFSYGTAIMGGALVDGDLGVNGSIYALNPTTNTGINVANNGLSVNGATNTTSLVADSNATQGDGRGQLILQESQASMLVYNQQTGQAHGLAIGQTSTVLSGGTQSTSLTLSDDGATFTNTTTGGPAHVTGISNGYSKYDAVNFGQLREAYGGIAAVAAMANIPAPPPGKQFSIGVGFGNFEGENAFALGGAARLTDNVSFQASIGQSDDNSTVGAGVGFSW